MKERIKADRLLIQWNVTPKFEKYAPDKFFYTHLFRPSSLDDYIDTLNNIMSYAPVAVWKIKMKQ